MDEEQIIKQVLDGDQQAYEHLVQRYHVGLIIRCEQIIGNRADAEDIAQVAFIKAYEQLASYKPHTAKFSTWLYTIAIRSAIDYVRKTTKQKQVEYQELLDADAMPDYDDVDTAEDVRRAVAALEPPAYQEVIRAYYWLGKSYQEIAAQQNVPINTVRTWLRRAKQQLKEDLS